MIHRREDSAAEDIQVVDNWEEGSQDNLVAESRSTLVEADSKLLEECSLVEELFSCGNALLSLVLSSHASHRRS